MKSNRWHNTERTWVLVEQLEWSAQNDLEQLIELGEFARVERILREVSEKLPTLVEAAQ